MWLPCSISGLALCAGVGALELPAFVEWLMGWPIGMTDYASPATASCDALAIPLRDGRVLLQPRAVGGTGTTAMVARALGRTGISLDLSADYNRLARWRIWESGGAAKVADRTARGRQGALL